MTSKDIEAAESTCSAEAAAPAKGKSAAKAKSAKGELTTEIVLQCSGGEWNVDELKEKAIDAYVAEGHKRGCITKFALYLKPEERKAYYVVNDKAPGGSIDME